MFDAKQRVIGAAYVMPESLSQLVLQEIRLLRPSYENASNNEVAESVILDQEHLNENEIKERIIGAAMVMQKDEACKIWDFIHQYISIPEATEAELDQALDVAYMKASSQPEKN